MGKTVQEIANEFNLSITTVRFIINGNAERYRISKQTENKVLEYIKTHGLIVNHAARSLKLKKTETLGIIIPRLSNPFFARLIETYEAYCRTLGYQLIFSCSQNNDKEEANLIKMMLSRGVDGLFIACNSKASQKQALKNVTKPIVFIDRDFNISPINSIITDNFTGGYELAKAMCSQTTEALVVFVGADSLPTIHSRLNGIQAYCQEYDKGNFTIIKLKGNTSEHGQKGMQQFLKDRALPNVMITSSLNILEGCLFEAKTQGLLFDPKAIFGTFDYHPMLEFIANELFVVEQNRTQLVESSVDLMLKLLENQHLPPQTFESTPFLIHLNKPPLSN